MRKMLHVLSRRIAPILLLCFLLSGAPLPARGEEARELTALCEIRPASVKKNFKECLDGTYKTYWRSNGGKGASFSVALPTGETAAGVWLQWYEHPHAASVQLQDTEGNWTEYARSDGVFLSDYLPLPEDTTFFRVANAAGVTSPMPLAELHVYSPGELPRKVQRWNPPAEKADLMIIAAHPDDEILWFGGMMPTYAGQEGKICQVCIMVPTIPRRRLELLDCLWTCGVKNYPVWGHYRDSYTLSLKEQYARWDKQGVYKTITGWIRRFKPDVLATHDLNGEYGHGGHRACADAVTQCLSLAANAKKFRESAKEYGTWNVPKCYLHLYEKNQLDLDWQRPLSAFGGKTAFEVAQEAFACHVSQQGTDYHVEDSGPCDCSLFGLYRSLVGEDVRKDSLFENLETPGS